MIFASLIASILIFVWAKPKQNVLLDPLTLFFVGLLYYGYFIPVLMTIFKDYFIPFLSDGITVSDEDIVTTSIMLPLGFFGFVLGYRVFTSRSYVDEISAAALVANNEPHEISGRVLAITFGLLISICVFFFFNDLIMVLSGYEGKIQTRYEGSTFSLVYNLTLTSAVILMAWVTFHSRNYLRLGLLFAAGLALWALMTFSKEPFVYAGLVLFVISARAFPKSQAKTLVLALAGAVVLLLFLVPSFSIYRATGELDFVSPADLSLPFLFSDASGPFSALILSIRNEAAVQLGPLYESLILWIPRNIWANRPLDAAEDFARAVITNWQPGYGLGFSPFAEARLRFGTLLSPVLLFLSGLSLSWLQQLALRVVPPSIAPALLLVVQGYIMFTFHRGTFSGIFTAMMQFWLPFLATVVVLNVLLRPPQPALGPLN